MLSLISEFDQVDAALKETISKLSHEEIKAIQKHSREYLKDNPDLHRTIRLCIVLGQMELNRVYIQQGL